MGITGDCRENSKWGPTMALFLTHCPFVLWAAPWLCCRFLGWDWEERIQDRNSWVSRMSHHCLQIPSVSFSTGTTVELTPGNDHSFTKGQWVQLRDQFFNQMQCVYTQKKRFFEKAAKCLCMYLIQFVTQVSWYSTLPGLLPWFLGCNFELMFYYLSS